MYPVGNMAIQYGRTVFNQLTLYSAKGLAVLDLNNSDIMHHFFDCSSEDRPVTNLVWEREYGHNLFPTSIVNDKLRLNMSGDISTTDLGVFICRDVASGEDTSINITGGLNQSCLK